MLKQIPTWAYACDECGRLLSEPFDNQQGAIWALAKAVRQGDAVAGAHHADPSIGHPAQTHKCSPCARKERGQGLLIMAGIFALAWLSRRP